MIDVEALATAVVPFLTAAIGAYGSQVVSRATDQGVEAASDAFTGGRRELADLVARCTTETGAASPLVPVAGHGASNAS